MSERRQWRAVGIDRDVYGDTTEPGGWRDNRTEAVADREAMLAARPDYYEVVIEVRTVTEPQRERVPFIPRDVAAPEPDTMAYIGINPCGCVTWVRLIGVESPADDAAAIARAFADGRRIDRVTRAEAANRVVFNCAHRQAA